MVILYIAVGIASGLFFAVIALFGGAGFGGVLLAYVAGGMAGTILTVIAHLLPNCQKTGKVEPVERS